MSVVRLDRWLGLLAAVAFVLAVAGFGAGLDGYAQGRHPVALLGARGVPHALAFNLVGFVLPGLLAAGVAERLRRTLPTGAGWAPRVGSQMLLLAGLAFAAMGALPLDVDDLHGPASQLHASAWMIWVLGFVAGSVLLAVSGLRQAHGRALGVLALGCGVLAALAAFALQGVLPAPLAQRLAFACWAVWLTAALPLSRLR
ncbi:membrane protein [Stenotrophomonas maltophilia]|nr:membrane protein [Stenotrophomonas maltophilia]